MFRPTPQPELTTRFAPSPTGYLHKGHAYSAYLNYLHACSAGGHLVLRIDDLDGSRCRPAYETAALEDLSWLGNRSGVLFESRVAWGTERAGTGRWLPARRPGEPPLRPALRPPLRFDP